jgi:hypothetical protein
VLRLLQFIDCCDGVILHGNPTVAASVQDQIVLAETECPSPLARLEEPRRGKIGPVRAAHRTTLDIYTRAVSQQKRDANTKVVEMMLPGAQKKLQHSSASSTTLEAVG